MSFLLHKRLMPKSDDAEIPNINDNYAPNNVKK